MGVGGREQTIATMAQLQLSEAETLALGRADLAIQKALKGLEAAAQAADSAGVVTAGPPSSSNPALSQAVADAIRQCVDQVGSFSPSLCHQRLLATGRRLVEMKEFAAARDLCFDVCASVQPSSVASAGHQNSIEAGSSSNSSNRANVRPTITRGYLEIKVAAEFGSAMCSYHLLVAVDPQFRFVRSVEQLRNLLRKVQSAQNLLLTAENDFQEQLYHLAFNGTVHLYTMARSLIVHGHAEHATEFLTWSILVMESIISLSTVKYVDFHSQLVSSWLLIALQLAGVEIPNLL